MGVVLSIMKKALFSQLEAVETASLFLRGFNTPHTACSVLTEEARDGYLRSLLRSGFHLVTMKLKAELILHAK